MTNSGHLT